MKRIKTSLIAALVVFVAVLGACFLPNNKASAFTSGCDSTVYWKFPAVQLMCYEDEQVGSMWIAAYGDCGSFVYAESASGLTVNASLCGMYDRGEGSHLGTYISLSGNDDGAIGNIPSSMWRGPYLSPGSATITINVDRFVSRASRSGPDGNGNLSYTRTFGVYRCNGAYVPPYSPSGQFCGSDDVSVTILIPSYNFETEVSATINKEVVYNNEVIPVNGTARDGKDGYKGRDVDGGAVRFAEFYLDSEIKSDAVDLSGGEYKYNNNYDKICPFFEGKLGSNIKCNDFYGEGIKVNGALNYSKDISRTVPGDLPIGAKYCVAIGIRPKSGSGVSVNNNWNISNASCRTVAKKPSMDIIGNIFANGQVNSSLSSKVDGMNYGSWGQYLVVANGEVVNFASGSAFGVGTNDLDKTFPLTIANKDSKYKLGKAKISTLSAFGNNVRNYCGVGNLDSDYDIKSNVSSFQIICGKNINISPSVKEINAWLIADNTINTCADVSNDDLYDKCNNKLTINGLVYAKDLILNRTYGAEYSTDYYTTAEEINLTTDGYKHAYEQKSGASDRANYLYTRYQKELLPRY